jgi:hypothetical protein
LTWATPTATCLHVTILPACCQKKILPAQKGASLTSQPSDAEPLIFFERRQRAFARFLLDERKEK